MRFARHGRTYQMVIESEQDIEDVLGLDESHWLATSAPVSAFRGDPRFLEILDADRNGRIASDEVRAVVRWTLAALADRTPLVAPGKSFPLQAINTANETGQALIASARYVLTAAGQPQADALTIEQLRTFLSGVQSQKLNGDGIVPPDAASDAEMAAFVRDIVAATGGATDVGGKTGAASAHLRAFLAGIPAWLAWRRKGQVGSDGARTEIMPLGERTPRAHAMLCRHAAAVDLFFALCSAMEFDAGTVPKSPDTAAWQPADSAAVDSLLRQYPIARPNPEGVLRLCDAGTNPFYREWLIELRAEVLEPILGLEVGRLRLDAWRTVRLAFSAYEAYLREKPQGGYDAIPAERLRQYLDPAYETAVLELIAADQRVSVVLRDARQLERLLLCSRHLLEFLNNFVSLPYLYAPDKRAMFEVGSAVLDGRWFNFTLRVDDVAAHSAVAKGGELSVMYLEVTGGASEAFRVVAPITSGTRGNLAVGKRGVLFGVDNREFDARIVQIVENPISLGEALMAPFARLWRLAQGKVEAWSSSAEKDLQKEFDRALAVGSTPASAPPPAEPAKPDAAQQQARQPGMMFGLGVTLAAMGSSFAFITKTFAGLNARQVGISLTAAALAVTLPIILIAALRLRRQDLSVLLEGSGWAVNARMRLNRQQRRQFTMVKPYPPEADGIPRKRWRRVLIWAIVLVLASFGGNALRRHLLRPTAPEDLRIAPPAPAAEP